MTMALTNAMLVGCLIKQSGKQLPRVEVVGRLYTKFFLFFCRGRENNHRLQFHSLFFFKERNVTIRAWNKSSPGGEISYFYEQKKNGMDDLKKEHEA